MTLDNILEEIKKADTILLLAHENPDGDAIGSVLAMHLALKKIGKKSDILMDDLPKTYDFLPGMKDVKKENNIEKYDLVIALDASTVKVLGNYAEKFENAKCKIVIDHHGTNTMFGDLNYVDQESPACCQILLVLFSYFNIELDKDIGTCILAGIITDTGGFRYDGVTAETFQFVAKLSEIGVKIPMVYQRVYASMPKTKFDLLRIAINRLEFLYDGKVAYTYITKQDEEKVNAQSGDHDGIVEKGRDVEGVEVSVFLRETPKGIKASLRSKEYVNVAEIGRIFGGGGHVRAAGCTVQGSIEQVKLQILNQIKAVLK